VYFSSLISLMIRHRIRQDHFARSELVRAEPRHTRAYECGWIETQLSVALTGRHRVIHYFRVLPARLGA
jgi:hypothetical protein